MDWPNWPNFSKNCRTYAAIAVNDDATKLIAANVRNETRTTAHALATTNGLTTTKLVVAHSYAAITTPAALDVDDDATTATTCSVVKSITETRSSSSTLVDADADANVVDE